MVDLGSVRPEADRIIEIVDGLGVEAKRLPAEATIEVGRRLRLNLEGAAEIVDRRPLVVLRAVDIAAADIGGGVFRIDVERLIVIGERLLQPVYA